MKYLLLLLLIIFPFGQLARWPLFGTEAVLHLNDLVVLIVLLVGLRKVSGPVARALLLFALAIGLSLAINAPNFTPRELIVAALYPARFFAYAGLYFVFQKVKFPTKRWLLMAALIVALSGLLQYILLPNVAFLSAQDWDDHYFRLVGTYLDPGFTGAILVLGLLVAATWPARILIYLAMALTYSRASYLMYLVSFAALAVYKKSLKIFVLAAVVLFLTIPLLPKSTGEGTKLTRENSLLARIGNWQESLTIWQTAPVFGVGFNTYRYVRGIAPESHSGAGADSSILLVLATTGLVGLLAYLNLLRVMWQTARGNIIFKISFLGILVHSFFNNTLFYPWVMEWLWILLALSSLSPLVPPRADK